MSKPVRLPTFILAALCASAAALGMVSRALADQTISPNGLPVINIHSSGGSVTLFQGDDPNVQVSGLNNIRVTHFLVNQAVRPRIMLPGTATRLFGRRGWRMFRLPPRQFSVPTVNQPADGISIDNPGGDMAVAIPRRVGAVVINSPLGDVVLRKYRGPFVIVANGGTVRLQNVAGRGMIRTVSGNIELNGVGGDIHIQTATGAVVARASFAESADVVSQGGSIDWRFARVGGGAYRFRTTDAPIRLGFRPGVAALVDAQSGQGLVQSTFDAVTGQTRFSSPHALSIAVNGGGSEITAASMSGAITIEPVNPVPGK
ncbi:MAG TPA: hypothetical protein VKR99_02015 [Candidatus Eremiobacteraceae bacterium]|nr:hypothetical protein [Candidatus Eremiobacteraceae bacterium]